MCLINRRRNRWVNYSVIIFKFVATHRGQNIKVWQSEMFIQKSHLNTDTYTKTLSESVYKQMERFEYDKRPQRSYNPFLSYSADEPIAIKYND